MSNQTIITIDQQCGSGDNIDKQVAELNSSKFGIDRCIKINCSCTMDNSIYFKGDLK